MHEPSPRRRRVTAAAVGALVIGVVLGGPAALAQRTEPEPTPPRWSGSAFEEPLDEFVTETSQATVQVNGTFRFEKPTSTSEIVGAEVSLVDDDTDDFTPRDRCFDQEPVTVPSDGTAVTESVDTLHFEIPELALACNGRHVVEATATTNVEDHPSYTMRAVVVVERLPPPVRSLSLQADAGTQQVTLDWQPVPEAELPPDAVDYLVERAGPADGDGSFGHFADLEPVSLDAAPRWVDEPAEPGTYRYRVRTRRDGVEGPVEASILDTATETATMDPPPPESSTSTTTTSSTGRSRVGNALPTPSSRPTPTRSPPTTADTGFEETLDYGELPAPTTRPPRPSTTALPAENPLAGQSIVREEGSDRGVVEYLVPAAGALVLVGWAGHLVYLNRLAKQL